MARLERIVLSDDSSDEDRKPSTPSRRKAHYRSRRGNSFSRPTTGTSRATSNPTGKRVTYEDEPNFDNWDEQAVPPPVENPDDEPTYRRQSRLEERSQGSTLPSRASQTPKSSERHETATRRRSGQQEHLTEVAAPPPVQKSLHEEPPNTQARQHYLEEEERGEPDSNETSPAYRQKQPGELEAKDHEVPEYLTELYTISYLIFFAILGTLARLGTQWITFYPGTPVVTPVIWANFGGSLIMGFVSEDQGLFRMKRSGESRTGLNGEKSRGGSEVAVDDGGEAKADYTKRKKTIPLYVGVATGFCGSYTSFSSFARDIFLALSNSLPTPVNHPNSNGSPPTPSSTVSRNGGYSFEAFLHVVISTIALSLGGLIVGAQMAIFMDSITPRIHGTFIRKYVDRGMVLLGFGSWLASVFLAIWPPDRPGGPSSRGSWSNETWRGEVIFALVFAPIGCLLRFYASAKLNGLVPAFPLGTFAANMFGTAIEGMCFDIQHVGVGSMGQLGGGRVGCQVLQGVQDGFCGCLTTVSTWVAEINGLKRKHGWGYAFGSVVGALCLMLVIMGSVSWSIGYISPVACKTGYVDKVHG